MADSDDDDNDNTFVTIGTPLEVYENDEVVSRKPVSIEDQVVKDAQGRQRFHGAFTGGFSAGYFNTVGSKEGWAPKTFVSSRSQRHEASVGQKPEDFMDEEDLGEFGIAPRIIATKQNFLSNERERKRKAVAVAALSGKSAIPGVESLLVDLILPKKSSIGIRLLRKLGWKEGQGIGPRSRKMPAEPEEDQPQTVSEGQKVYGCMLPPGFSAKEKNLSSEDSDEDYNSVSFAPKDVCPVNFEPKDNLHGIGYRGLDPRLALGNFSFQEPAAVTTKVGRRGIRGQAFGVGAFENDDDDIYSSESMANYDVEITEEKPDSANFGWTGSHQRRGDKFTRHETDVLPGFVKAVVAVQPRRNYPPPQLPRDFKPFHKFESQEGSQKTPNSTAGQKTLDASTRGVLLGEAPHLNSVFELVSNEDRSKMEAAKMQGEILKKQQQTEQSSLDSTKSVRADHQLGSTASTPTATKLSAFGFKPFAKFPEKQKRYEEYLEAVKHGKTYEPTCGSNTTEWEQEHEREEFAQAARLYRPLAGMIASRFTRAEHGDDDNVTLPPKQDVEKSDKEKAASMKMFGKLTRDRFEWHPDKVLCKRFNIANPYPDSTVVGVPSVKRDKYSVFNFLNFPSQDEVQPPPVHVREEPKAAEVVSAKLKPLAILATVDLRPRVEHVTVSADSEVSNTASPSGAAEGVVTQSSDHTTATTMSEADGRPPMDLFKAIFENSDSDDSDEVASDKEDGAKEPQPAPNATVALPLASAQVTPPSDIPRDAPSTAAAISHTKQDSDIGFLAASFINETAEKAKCEESSQSEDNKLPSPPTTTPSAAAFGPSLPPPVSTESSSKALDSHGRHRRHHRRKESHKHKKAKHKKKEKKQKDKKRKKRKEVIEVDSSSSDDADKEDEDTDDDDDDDDIAGLDRTLLDRLKTMAARR